MTQKEIEKRIEDNTEHISKLYDRVFDLAVKLGENSAKDAYIAGKVKQQGMSTTKKGGIIGSIGTVFGGIIYFILEHL